MIDSQIPVFFFISTFYAKYVALEIMVLYFFILIPQI